MANDGLFFSCQKLNVEYDQTQIREQVHVWAINQPQIALAVFVPCHDVILRIEARLTLVTTPGRVASLVPSSAR